jgi:uncharacterized zinc-type alcohol dehydrogenase-like protein
MYKTKAYAAASATSLLGPISIPRRDANEHDVQIEILFCGICHSDLHTVRDEWSAFLPTTYPCVPGHEILGRVTKTGTAVTKFKPGDLAAVGCLVDSDGTCAECKRGLEQFCPNAVFTYGAPDKHLGGVTYGGYSDSIVVDERFVLRVPANLNAAAAAPLLCAGITTYSPLAHWKAGPGKKVAVVGMGGLGHMGVKIAAAMGAEVTVLSQTLSKKDDGLRFGAQHYHATSDPATFEALANSFDLIVNTVSAPVDMAAYLGLLRLDGTLVSVGAPPEPLPVQVFSLFGNRRSFAGSSIGGIAETQEMLDFCAEHGIAPEVELIDADAVNEAYERVLRSDVRYRFVIDIASLR